MGELKKTVKSAARKRTQKQVLGGMGSAFFGMFKRDK